MKTMIIVKIAGVIIAGLSLSLLSGKAVHAANLHNNWYYAADSLNDSVSGNDVGGTKYEIAGTAYTQKNGKSIFSIVTKLPLEGTNSGFANDGRVALGDILLNFTTDSFNVASEKGNLKAIRFVDNNEAGVNALGFYDNVVAKSVSSLNGLRLANVGAYHDYVKKNGGTPSMGDLPINTSEIDSSQHILNVIDSGTWRGNVNLLDSNALKDLGFDFGYFGVEGFNTIAVSVDSSLLPDGRFTALFSPECGNDIAAMSHIKTSVPESSTILGLLAFGMVGAGSFVKSQKSSVKLLN
ncbi:XDD3 family exosortase-dependent surface protein [Nodularia sp. NIES-3585]|uniref:XDD3 family exosortase-dependent surface protein n=1 Tax=Nodularia sp. NIES-3585 TaxID=1973477 RepID=UPI000B5CA80D|nr:XDD3 family exosortase-dependent surface protein [Nodularia sp. NIES-3585]